MTIIRLYLYLSQTDFFNEQHGLHMFDSAGTEFIMIIANLCWVETIRPMN